MLGAIKETTIDRDREFDQTAKTEDTPRNVSPAIWEHRYLMEKQRREAAERVTVDTINRLNVALDRIAGFERLNAALAAKVDEMIEAGSPLAWE